MSLQDNLQQLLGGINISYFDCAMPWDNTTINDYERHFQDSDPLIRARSVLVFTGMVGNAYFQPADVLHIGCPIPQPEPPMYDFEKYIRAFMVTAPSIKSDYPTIYTYTVFYLYHLDQRRRFEESFPHIDPQIFSDMREKIFAKENIVDEHYRLPSFKGLLIEADLPPFFLSDQY